MAIYFDKDILSELSLARDIIFETRTQIYLKYKIDMLETDSLSALTIFDIVNQYDTDYNINFARTGEDAKSTSTLIELKCSKVSKATQKAGFMFHALGDIERPRYIFAIRHKENLNLLRLYDIGTLHNVSIVQTELMRLKQKYLEKGFRKYDGISITEKFLIENIVGVKTSKIDGCIVNRA